MSKPGKITNELLYHHLMETKQMISIIGSALGLDDELSSIAVGNIIQRVKSGLSPVESLIAIRSVCNEETIPKEYIDEIDILIEQYNLINEALG